jgi:TatD DNase family protein
MFSDTHFHLQHLAEGGSDVAQILTALAEYSPAFGLDIGTQSGDIDKRLNIVRAAMDSISDPAVKNIITEFLHFSLGIWPHKEAILNRAQVV